MRPLWTGCLAFCNGTAPKVVYQVTFARLLGNDPRGFTCLGAQRGGRLIGWTHHLSHRHARKVEEGIYRRIFMLSPTCAVRVRAGTPLVYRLRQEFNSEARRLSDRSAAVTPFTRCSRRLQALRALR